MKRNLFSSLLAIYLLLSGVLLIGGDGDLLGLPILRYATAAFGIAAGVIYFLRRK